MILRARSAIVLLWLAATVYSARAFEPPPAVAVEQPESADGLARQVYDVFRQQCIKCHGVAKAGGLDLRTEDGLRKGGTRGPVVVPHKPDDSPLFKYVSHSEAPFMPADGGKLSDDSLDLIRDWIESGASIATVPEASPNAAAAAAEMATLEERAITAAERAYWAFVKPVRVSPPLVSSAEWKSNPIDAFLFAAMDKKGLVPAAPADKRTLVRRAYLDVLGLPPTPAEIDAFVNDRSADAWPRLVDRLLASPHYGERWARHWMDLVREEHVVALMTDEAKAAHAAVKAEISALEKQRPWHGEFGRLPISERMDGRDHNNRGFSVWLAGGGIKGGTVVGTTDRYGYAAAENPTSVYELHATILHILGLDFEKLTYRFNGRDMRLTDVHGRIIKEILA